MNTDGGKALSIGEVLHGNCLELLEGFPEKSVDLVFADPPYNLQLSGDLWRPNMTRVDGVDDAWDKFDSFEAYDAFSRAWLKACRRVLKDTGALWVIGTYHNIYRLGAILQDLKFWMLNDVLWIKTNPMPNFRGVRFTNAHETLIWAAKSKDAKYTFHHHAMKSFNDGKQMRSDWRLPICTGEERIKIEGQKVHSTQKPEALLYRVIVASTNPGDIVLDPFFGTGTTGAVAKRLKRHWIGIEQEENYVQIARERIARIQQEDRDDAVFEVADRRRHAPRVPFARLLELGLMHPGQMLYFMKDEKKQAIIKSDGKLMYEGTEGSIHQVGKSIMAGSPCNGWDHWYYVDEEGEYVLIDEARKIARRVMYPG